MATQKQKELLQNTVSEFRYLVRGLVGVIYTHWATVGQLSSDEQVPAVERLIHATAKNPDIKYSYFGSRFHKFPSYYRRGAIQFAVGQVSSFVTRYREWQSGIRKRKDALPPRLNADCGTYPPLYKNQYIRFAEDSKSAQIKVFTGSDWVWTAISITGHRERHLNPNNQRKSPYLIVNAKGCHLSVPFQIKTPKLAERESVLSVDLGINTTAQRVAQIVVLRRLGRECVRASIVNFDGTQSLSAQSRFATMARERRSHREFIHPGRDIDRRDKRLKRVSKKARLTGRLSKGFARGLYRKTGNINREIGQKVSARLVKIAKQYSVKYIVFEHLKGWRPRGGKKRSNLRQRFHGWLHRRIVDLTQMKWSELGGKVSFVYARGTSSNAFDGSGKVKRSWGQYEQAVFATGKKYNCDLSASYNIGARFILQLLSRNDSQDEQGKNSCSLPRSRGTLSMLWSDRSTL